MENQEEDIVEDEEIVEDEDEEETEDDDDETTEYDGEETTDDEENDMEHKIAYRDVLRISKLANKMSLMADEYDAGNIFIVDESERRHRAAGFFSSGMVYMLRKFVKHSKMSIDKKVTCEMLIPFWNQMSDHHFGMCNVHCEPSLWCPMDDDGPSEMAIPDFRLRPLDGLELYPRYM